MVLEHHLEYVHASAEDAAGEGAELGLAGIVGSDAVDDLDELLGDGEELGLVETIVYELVEDLEGAVQLAVGGGGDEVEQVGEQVGPVVGEVAASNLADDEAGSGLELAVEGIGGDDGEQVGADLLLDIVGDDEGALELLEVVAPAGENDLLEVK